LQPCNQALMPPRRHAVAPSRMALQM